MINININSKDIPICALYGLDKQVINVSEKIKECIENQQTNLTVNNKTMGHDPCVGKKKSLILTINNRTYKIRERHSISFTFNKIITVKKIILQENIKLINNLFSKYNTVRIFGKGPTFTNIEKKKESELYIGINQTVNELTDCDILALNDLHNINKIDTKIFAKLKFIIMPEYLHIEWKFDKKGHWSKVYDKINDIFNGYYIIFNLVTSKIPNPLLVSLSNGISTANTVAEFVCLFLKKYIIKIDFHGIGINSAKNYHDKFIGFGYYNNRRIEYIKKNLTDTCTKYKISFSFN